MEKKKKKKKRKKKKKINCNLENDLQGQRSGYPYLVPHASFDIPITKD